MADGSRRDAGIVQLLLPDADRGIFVDLFAGGGGVSTGVERALGRPVDVAINHDPDAISMHRVNHPHTEHYQEDVYATDPRKVAAGRHVYGLHASPDCTDHSQAKGGQPRNEQRRSLSWVVLKWAGTVRPDVITLENVMQIRRWTRLVAKRDKATGRVIRLDGSVAPPGERTPREAQYLIPDGKTLGRTWRRFKSVLQAMGYVVEDRLLRSCDYSDPTSRTRLYLVARCDGKPIVFPEPTHGAVDDPGVRGKERLPMPVAADCIDFSIPAPSIFLSKEEARTWGVKRPLAPATMRRIARGVRRFVLETAQPFLVPIQNYGWGERCASLQEPMRTVAAYPKGGGFALATPSLVPCLVQTSHGEGKGSTKRWGSGAHSVTEPMGVVHAGGGSFALVAPHLLKIRGDSCGARADGPMPVITSGAGSARPAGAAHALGVVSAFLEQANGGFYTGDGNDVRKPAPTICGTGSQQRLVTVHLVTLHGTSHAADANEPLGAVTAGGNHHAVVTCMLSPAVESRALEVAKFLREYGAVADVGPLQAIGVVIEGIAYVITDIGLRMLQPRELYRAQGFPDWYVIDRGHDGRRFSKSTQVRMCGNSVSPGTMAALIRANFHRYVIERAAA